MNTSIRFGLDEYRNALLQLSLEEKNDVLDITCFILWIHRLAPAPFKSVLRGAWLFLKFKLKKVLDHVQLGEA